MEMVDKMRIIGVLSGTSCDGIDVAICDIFSSPKKKEKLSSPDPLDFTYRNQLVYFETVPYDQKVKDLIHRVIRSENISIKDVCVLNFEIGRSFGKAIIEVCKKGGFKLEEIDLIGSHGQTVWHEVSKENEYSTLQIGEASVMCAMTGIPVVSDFRTADVALNGQGAPLTSIQDMLMSNIHSRVSSDENVPVWIAIQNIGGIGNVSLMSSRGEFICFDTGPGNILMNCACEILYNVEYDEDGKFAAKGKVNNDLLKWIMGHPFFSRKPPKTTGREEFSKEYTLTIIKKANDEFKMKKEDVISTLCQVTVNSIFEGYVNFGPKDKNQINEIELNGGGSFNKELVKRLGRKFPKASITLQDKSERDGKEGKLFALLAYLNSRKRYSNLPSVTGAKKSSILGKYTSMFAK